MWGQLPRPEKMALFEGGEGILPPSSLMADAPREREDTANGPASQVKLKVASQKEGRTGVLLVIA